MHTSSATRRLDVCVSDDGYTSTLHRLERRRLNQHLVVA